MTGWPVGVALAALVALAVFCAPAPPARGAAQAPVARHALIIDLDGFSSPAELTYPADAAGPFPTVVLIHGSGPADMDFTLYTSFGGRVVLSHIFADIADYLSARGFAVLRYNKRYVRSATDIDVQSYYGKVDLPLLLADAERALDTARAQPRVDSARVYLYGWSEGSTIAAALAARRPDIAGLIVQGPVAQPWATTLRRQIIEVGVPYLRSLAPNGLATAATLDAAMVGQGGTVAKSVLLYLLAPSFFQDGDAAINPLLDRDEDGAISIDGEFLPQLETLFGAAFAPGGFFNIYSPGRALPTVTEQAASLRLPILVLQGGNDANTMADGIEDLARALAGAGPASYQVNLYGDLGHSLGPARSRIDDAFRPIAEAPMADTVAWLRRQSATSAASHGLSGEAVP
ncbi:MAG: alpha/beta hydrolase [Dehalococcoidia bacterium]